jgi:aminobenzoyl-glutamate utilization protein B
MTNPPEQAITGWLTRNETSIAELADRIRSFSEPSLREYRSCQALCDFLADAGFEIERKPAGLPTAFVATSGSGSPVIATYAEYDATPGQSQKPVPYREAVVPHAAGFTDAHHMLGTASCAAAIATAHTMRQHDLPGTIKVFGTPAEKLVLGKPYMAKDGYFDDVDAFCTWHPGHTSNNLNTTRTEGAVGSSYHVVFNFFCDEPWKWSGLGGLAGVRHPGAFDAMQLMFMLTRYMRDYKLPRLGGWTISEFIMNGGQATADNWPVDVAQIYYALRSPELDMQDIILERLEECAHAAAAATYTRVETRIISKTRPGLPNATLSRLMYRNLERVGPPRFTEQEKDFARELQRGIGLEPMDEPFNEELTPPEEAERIARQHMLPTQRHRGSDDSSELSWHAPMGRLMVGGSALRPTPGAHYPIWFEGALSGTTTTHKMGLVAAKVIALSMTELLTTPTELEAAKAEHRDRIAKTGKLEPLLPKDLTPPIHYRWPEWTDNRYANTDEPPTNLRWSVPPL